MSTGELTPGDGLLLRAFCDHPAPTVKLNYGAPKKRDSYHLAMWLGIWSEGSADVDERLNHLGWVFDPKRAAQEIAARSATAIENGVVKHTHSAPILTLPKPSAP